MQLNKQRALIELNRTFGLLWELQRCLLTNQPVPPTLFSEVQSSVGIAEKAMK